MVASHVPGRLRIRLRKDSRQASVLHHLQHDLQHRPGISGVSVNQDAGSLTVHYDAQRYPDSSLLDIRKDLDIILGAVLDVPHLAAVDSAPSQAAKTFINALEDLDHRVSALTGRTLNLRVLVPLGLVGGRRVAALQEKEGYSSMPQHASRLPLLASFQRQSINAQGKRMLIF